MDAACAIDIFMETVKGRPSGPPFSFSMRSTYAGCFLRLDRFHLDQSFGAFLVLREQVCGHVFTSQGAEHHEAGTFGMVSQAEMILHPFCGDGHIGHLVIEENTFWETDALRHKQAPLPQEMFMYIRRLVVL
jgi:hypothetical protein